MTVNRGLCEKRLASVVIPTSEILVIAIWTRHHQRGCCNKGAMTQAMGDRKSGTNLYTRFIPTLARLAAEFKSGQSMGANSSLNSTKTIT